MERGQTLSGGEETLPCSHEGAIKWPWGSRKKIEGMRNETTQGAVMSHGTNKEIMTLIFTLKFQASTDVLIKEKSVLILIL